MGLGRFIRCGPCQGIRCRSCKQAVAYLLYFVVRFHGSQQHGNGGAFRVYGVCCQDGRKRAVAAVVNKFVMIHKSVILRIYHDGPGSIAEHAPRNSTELTSHEIGVLLLREKYILDKIKEYQALPPDQMITSSVMDMRVPGGRGKRKRDGANQQIGMYQKETPAQRILQLQEALNKIHGRILSAAAQMQKNEMDKLHLETEQQRLELLRIRATGEIGEPGDGDKDAVHE